MLLQNSFWITEHKFSGPLVRRSSGELTGGLSHGRALKQQLTLLRKG
jgi:hypothetical protein